MKIQFKYLILITWLVIIFIFSSQVANESSYQSGIIVDLVKSITGTSASEGILTFIVRKSAHIFMFFILGIFAYNVIKDYNLTTKKTIIFSILLALSYAIFDEIHQLFVPGRSGEITDILIDTTAATIGTLTYFYISKIKKSKLENQTDEKQIE